MASDSEKILSLAIQLKVMGKEDAAALRDLMAENKSTTSDLAKEMGVLTVSAQDVEAATKEEARATELSHAKKQELKEIIKKLTVDFPILGEVARMALNPMVLAVAGPIIAFKIWNDRVESLTQALGGIEMPDLTKALEDADKLGIKWKGIEDAIKAANKEFNSPDSIAKRDQDSIGKKEDADKKLNDLNKQRALANLDLQKGSMTDAQYQLGKAGIENFYTQKDYQIGATADEDRRKAKAKEMEDAQQRARDLAAKEKEFKLPQTKEQEDANIAALEARKKALEDQAALHRAEVAKIQDTMVTGGDGIGGAVRAIPGAVSFNLKYGYGGDKKAGEVIAEQNRMAQENEEAAAAVARQIADRRARFRNREEVRADAADAAGLNQRLQNQAPIDAADLRLRRSTNAQLNQGRQEVNVAQAVASINDGGKEAVAAINQLGASANQALREIARTAQRNAQQIQTRHDR